MEIFRQWAVSLVISGIAGTVVSLLAPRGNTEKALRTVVRIFVVCVLCSPLTKLETDAEFPDFSFEEYEAAQTDLLGKQLEETCRQAVGDVAREIAEELGITGYNVSADLYTDDEMCIIIQNIHVVLPADYKALASEFSKKMESRLGVPVTAECK